MPLNPVKGNMNGLVTHTWNTIKGECPHGCTYCYMRRFGKQRPVRFDEKELRTDLGSGNFIFVGSSCDMFADLIDNDWIVRTIDKLSKHQGNRYFLQTKNTFRLREWAWDIPEETVLCTTIETNRYLPTVMGETMAPPIRAYHFSECGDVERHITIEPIMEFDLERMIGLIRECKPKQVNIGADTGRNHLPEPPAGKVRELIAALSEFTTVHQKPNLARIFNDAKR